MQYCYTQVEVNEQKGALKAQKRRISVVEKQGYKTCDARL